ncbi:MAG: hypothetical protein Q9215_005623 [Flavoplaca cf. flavocitrina]
MPTLSLPTWTVKSVNGNAALASRQIMYDEMKEMLSTMPVNSVHFGDEDCNRTWDTMTIEKMDKASQTTLHAVFEAWTQLRAIISQHMPSLKKRWRRKTHDQRNAILIKTCPGIPPMHRPDFVALRKRYCSEELPFSLEIALRLPYINLEDLSQTENLLFFIESRGSNFPAVFTNMDQSHLRVGLKSKMLVPDYVRGHTMYLNGETTREGYGRIVSWEQDRQSSFKCYSGVAPDPGIGLMILQVQRDILEFLVRCSVAIMHDIPMADLIESPKHFFPSPFAKPTSCEHSVLRLKPGTSNTASLSDYMLEAPYRVPEMFNLPRLRHLVQARRCEVEDHFFAIREDPGYFAEVMHAASVDIMANRSKGSAKKDATWNTAISLILGTSYYDMFRWEAVSYLCDNLIESYTEHKDGIQPGRILPTAFVRAFSPLDFLLENLIVVQISYLRFYLAAASSLKEEIHPKLGGPKKSQKDDYLFWLYQELLKRRKDITPQTYSIHSILQEIDIFISRSPKEKDRLTPSLIRMMSELSIVAEMLRELSLSSCNEYALTAMPKEDILASVNPRFEPLANIQDVVNNNSFDLASIVKDLRVFDYPSDKARTAASTAKMRSAEQRLDYFWEQVDQHFVRKTGSTLKELEQNRISHRDIERTPPWEEVESPVNKELLTRKDATGSDTASALAKLEELTERTIWKSQTAEVRQKMKTRNPAIQEGETQSSAPSSGNSRLDPKVEAAKVRLRRKAYKAAFPIFAKIFGKPVINELSGKMVEELSGKIPWHQFITAMGRAGFGAEKLQGSCWLFSSDDRSIIFHEPHPESDLTTHLARRIARRLNRNFGWTAESFVLDHTSGGENLAST